MHILNSITEVLILVDFITITYADIDWKVCGISDKDINCLKFTTALLVTLKLWLVQCHSTLESSIGALATELMRKIVCTVQLQSSWRTTTAGWLQEAHSSPQPQPSTSARAWLCSGRSVAFGSQPGHSWSALETHYASVNVSAFSLPSQSHFQNCYVVHLSAFTDILAFY